MQDYAPQGSHILDSGGDNRVFHMPYIQSHLLLPRLLDKGIIKPRLQML